MNKEISRRDFLKLAGLTAGTTGLVACGIETNPDPQAVEARVKQLKTEAILKKEEVGTYNKENLRKWTEILPQSKLDPRLDIAITPSKIVRGEGSIEWHLDVATKLGFQSVSIPVSPPEHTQHTGIETPIDTPLYELIQRDYFDKVFRHPDIKRVHITCDVGRPEAASGWRFPGPKFTRESLQATYDEYKITAVFLLEKYGHLGKEIIIGGPNEVDLLGKGGYRPDTEYEDFPAKAYENAVLYFNTIYKAVKDANEACPDKAPLKTGFEVLQIRSEFIRDNAVTALDIVSSLDIKPDEVGLSAWQFAGKGKDGFWIGKAVELICQNAPGCDAVVTEFGIADSDRGELGREGVARLYEEGIKASWEAGAKRVTTWSLTGYDSSENFPNNDQIRGLGLIRPDGSFRLEVFNALREMSGLEKIV
jgi:hypothetical protein